MKISRIMTDACRQLVIGKDWVSDSAGVIVGDAVASVGAFLARALTAIKAQSVDVEYPELMAKELFPVSHEYPAGTEFIEIPSYEGKAIVKLINYYSTDLPVAEIAVETEVARVNNYGNAYEYSKREIRQSQLAGGKALSQRKADIAHKAHEEEVNRIAFNGDSSGRLWGIFTYPGIPKAAAAATFANSTWDEILAIMNTAVTDIIDTTLNTHTPNFIAMPIVQYRLISTTYPDTYPNKTILTLFQDANPRIEVKPVNEMKGAGTAGVDVMLVYQRDPSVLELQMLLEPTHNAPQPIDLGFKVAIESETGGLNVYRPMAINIVEDI